MPTNGNHGTNRTHSTHGTNGTTDTNGIGSTTGIHNCVLFWGPYSTDIIPFNLKQNHKIITYEYVKEKGATYHTL